MTLQWRMKVAERFIYGALTTCVCLLLQRALAADIHDALMWYGCDTSCRRKAEWALLLALGLGLLSLALIVHSHMSAMPQSRHAHRGHGRRNRMRTSLKDDIVSA